MTQPSYSVAVDGLMNVASIVGLFTVTMRWTDPVSGFLVDQERWHVPSTTASLAANNGLVIGRGPSKSAQLIIIVHNNDAANNMTLDLNCLAVVAGWLPATTGGAFRSQAASRIWSVGSREPNSNQLGYENAVSVGAGVTRQRLAALYCGQAFLSVALAAGNTVRTKWRPVSVSCRSLTSAQRPGRRSSPRRAGPRWSTPTSRCPDGPVVVQIANAGAGAVVVTWSLVLQEFAS